MSIELKESLRPLRTTIRRVVNTPNTLVDLPISTNCNKSPLKNVTQKLNITQNINGPRASLSKISQWPRRKGLDASPMAKIRKSLQTPVLERKRQVVEPSPSPIRKKSIRIASNKSRHYLHPDDVNTLPKITKFTRNNIDQFTLSSPSKLTSPTSSSSSVNTDFNLSTCNLNEREMYESLSSIAHNSKPTYKAGVSIFNADPVKGIRYMINHNFFSPSNPKKIAITLKNQSHFSREAIGSYIGTSEDLARSVLREFIDSIDMAGKDVDVALRELLYWLVPNGESQKIEALLLSFAQIYCKKNPNVSSVEDVHTLAYALMILHTAVHNKSANKNFTPISKEEFARTHISVRLSVETLGRMYERITSKEITSLPDSKKDLMRVSDCLIGPKKSKDLVNSHRRLMIVKNVSQMTNDPKHIAKSRLHTRTIFIFNDCILLAKELPERNTLGRLSLPRRSLANTRSSSPVDVDPKALHNQYTVKDCLSLLELEVIPFTSDHVKHGLQICSPREGKINLFFNNEYERESVYSSIKEAVCEYHQFLIGINLIDA